MTEPVQLRVKQVWECLPKHGGEYSQRTITKIGLRFKDMEWKGNTYRRNCLRSTFRAWIARTGATLKDGT